MLLIPAILVALSLPSTATRAGDAPSLLPWQARLSVETCTPVALPGLGIGGAADLSRQLFSGPFFVAARVGLTTASAANESWIIDHRQLILATALGARAQVGAGALWGEIGAGALGVEEVLSRHQLERIQMANVGGGAETSFALGPHAFAEAGVAVRMRGTVSAALSAGPTLARVNLA